MLALSTGLFLTLCVVWVIADAQVFLGNAIEQTVKMFAATGPRDFSAKGACHLLTHDVPSLELQIVET